jgi:hypothetical protein
VLPDRDALTIGMTLVPGLFSRNRMFALFTQPEMRAARGRAAQLRGAIRHLREIHGPVEILEFSRGGTHGAVLRYRVPGVRLLRRLELTAAEAACLSYVCHRAGLAHLPCHEGDRRIVEAALHRLAAGGGSFGGDGPSLLGHAFGGDPAPGDEDGRGR